MNVSTRRSANFGGFLERRGSIRFPVREDIRYRIIHSKTEIVSGSGTTLNISSGGIRFTTAFELPVGRRVDLSINWPVRLDGTCRLQLVVAGHVVRAESKQAAVRIEHYKFKTRREDVPAVFERFSRGGVFILSH